MCFLYIMFDIFPKNKKLAIRTWKRERTSKSGSAAGKLTIRQRNITCAVCCHINSRQFWSKLSLSQKIRPFRIKKLRPLPSSSLLQKEWGGKCVSNTPTPTSSSSQTTDGAPVRRRTKAGGGRTNMYINYMSIIYRTVQIAGKVWLKALIILYLQHL